MTENQPGSTSWQRFEKAFNKWFKTNVTAALFRQKEDPTERIRRIFGPHSETLRHLGVREVNWYGCVRESLGQPLWTWHEIWTMATETPNDGYYDYQGLAHAVTQHCVLGHKEYEPPRLEITKCDVRFSV